MVSVAGVEDVLAEQNELFAVQLDFILKSQLLQSFLNNFFERSERDSLLEAHEIERDDPVLKD
jgi:hypothetical protein